jgi:hypothetical protein
LKKDLKTEEEAMKRHWSKVLSVGIALALLALLAGPAAAQEAAAKKSDPRSKPVVLYRVDFTLYEKEDGTSANVRNYKMLMENGTDAQTRSESTVPVRVGEPGADIYEEVGVNIDCRLQEKTDYVLLAVTWQSPILPRRRRARTGPAFR